MISIFKDPLEQKIIEGQRKQERERLFEKLGEYEEELEKCERGDCPYMTINENECFYVLGMGCFSEPDEDGLLYCEQLEHKISRIEETLAHL